MTTLTRRQTLIGAVVTVIAAGLPALEKADGVGPGCTGILAEDETDTLIIKI